MTEKDYLPVRGMVPRRTAVALMRYAEKNCGFNRSEALRQILKIGLEANKKEEKG